MKSRIFLFYYKIYVSILFRRNVDSQKDFEDSVKRLTNSENDTVRPRTLIVMQRKLTFQRVCGQVLDASFKELCDRVRLHILVILSIDFKNM